MTKPLPKKQPGRMAQLKTALKESAAAQKAVTRLIAEHFPIGSSASWEKSGALQSGTVVDLDYGDRLKVRNGATGREYWIDCRWLQDPFE